MGNHLPPRYDESWEEPFYKNLADVLVPGAKILDVGSGATPTIPPDRRPEGCHYVGLDIDAGELRKAPPGSYNATVIADLTKRLPELTDTFDAVVSQFVFEHVRPLDVVIENLRTYLRPGGKLVSHLSGAWSVFAVLNRIAPKQLALTFLKLIGRDPRTVFKAYYHRCWYTALDRILVAWSEHQVVPRYLGAGYFRFARPLRRLYLLYEEWSIRSDRKNLASYYLIAARK